MRALEGFGETFYFPASMSLVSDYHDKATRSRAMAAHQSSVYAGTVLGSWIGAVMAERYGWRSGFYLFGGLGLVLALVLYKLLREPVRGESEAPPPSASLLPPPESSREEGWGGGLPLAETLRAIFKAPTVPLLMLAFLGANFVATIFLTWTPTFLVEKFGFKLAAAGLSGAAFIHIASAVSVPVAGFLADRLSQKHRGGRILVQATGLLLGAGFVWGIGHATTTPLVIAAMTAFGLCKGFYDSGIFASLYDSIEPRARGTAAGVMNTVGWGGGALGPLFIGWASKNGTGTEIENMSNAIGLGAIAYVLAAALLLAAAKSAQSR